MSLESDQPVSTEPSDDLPDAALFWRWAARSTRPKLGWLLLALGAVFIVVGYLGVSRESLVAKQIPYLVSGGIGGMTLVAVGAFLLGTEDLRGQLQRLDRVEEMVEDLHGVLLDELPPSSSGPPETADERAEEPDHNGSGRRRARSARRSSTTA